MGFARLPVSIALLVAVGLVGAVFGGFSCFRALRRFPPHGDGGDAPRCASCEGGVEPKDLLLPWRWIACRERCRRCGCRLPVRYLVSELVLAAAFAALALRCGSTLQFVEFACFCTILLFLSHADLQARTIPNSSVASAAIVRLAYLLAECAVGAMGPAQAAGYLLGAFAVGAALLAFAAVMDRVSGDESLGGGDLKLYCVACLYFGWEGGLAVVALSCILALVFAGAKALRGDGSAKRAIPFGPFISLACLAVMLAA